ncbi:N-acetylmuramoyl-L-alanine amidase [Streptomyces sp. NPDC005533]|uniref:N-acetylmuramoyl-L-alanine amidase n=1 Tax=Streptomyces sp. NPDC005533 TaxID=3364723 RepID=UPI0036AB04AC
MHESHPSRRAVITAAIAAAASAAAPATSAAAGQYLPPGRTLNPWLAGTMGGEGGRAAIPLTAQVFLLALLSEGVRIREHDGWRTHNRNHQGPWGPVDGVMLHHTAGTNSLRVCRTGLPNLHGPLCIGLIAKDGRVHLIGYGRTNHAGSGSAALLDALRRNAPIPVRTGRDTVDGNARFYGFEIENLGDGHDPYPAAQLDAVERVCAAISRAHGWSSGRVVAHKEWTRRKADPSFSMAEMRAQVAARLAGR